jgi:predicted nucleotidyltransferase component of viral defense system
MELPIEKKLDDQARVDRARLQDDVVESLYNVNPTTVLHGGTAIWRCYGGNRFSDDIGLYLLTDRESERVREGLVWAIRKFGIDIDKSRAIRDTTVVTVKRGTASVRIEMARNKTRIRPVDRNFERVNGTYLNILTLSPEDFIVEKIATYSNRRYVRDLYDIYHLSNMVENGKSINRKMCNFLRGIEKPADEGVLKSIVYAGAVPSFQGMVSQIKRRFCEVHR